MEIKEQIAQRMAQLGLSQSQVAAMVKNPATGNPVSRMAVRKWLMGEGPGKDVGAEVEKALKFKIDWNEGGGTKGSVMSMVSKEHMQLVLDIARLPPETQRAITVIVRQHLTLLDRAAKALQD